jgi:hypothetical protein
MTPVFEEKVDSADYSQPVPGWLRDILLDGSGKTWRDAPL